MEKIKHKDKNVIWESKTKQIILIIICFLFTFMVLWTGKVNEIRFWFPLILFGGGGFFVLIRFLNPKNLFVSPNSTLGKEIISLQTVENQNDLGIFTYNEDSFTIADENHSKTYRWNEIKTVFAYKTDLLTEDEICIDVYTQDSNKFTISESTWGWFQFISRLSENIKSIKIDWYVNIISPAFEKNLTLLYDKENRKVEEIIKQDFN
ncbi:hypothetical protein [Flavobacterium gelatinilyticum]|uniref:hypothetical protein n=1 Tax=Flavobacterium gelatinilyticum TaxID=3003260 RepID=UPI0024807BFC|nr:hypothetical protein [Flavobacterium gelatinilyticum]